MRILVIEDNDVVANAVRSMLESRKFAVDTAADGETGLDYLLRGVYDAAVVDVGLPRRDGFSIAHRAREHDVHTPILMLTARDGVEDRVTGLNAGADDYLAKPFAEDELIARLNALLRRGSRPVTERVTCGDLTIDVGTRSAAILGEKLDLGTTEYRLLEFLARNAGITFSRAQLLEHVWEYEFEGSSNIVDVYVSQLRRKLKAAGASKLIVTVWGVGYRLTT